MDHLLVQGQEGDRCCVLLVPSAQHKRSRGGRFDNGLHLVKGRDLAEILQPHLGCETASMAGRYPVIVKRRS